MKQGVKIKFKYNNRNVMGIVQSVSKKRMCLLLESDYLGKNDDWYAGDYKDFYLKNIKKLQLLPSQLKN